jgi:septal ring factor EnvC (AmiA/AmiB activator)
MGYDGVLLELANWVVAGGGASIGFFTIRWLAIFFAGRFDKQAERIDKNQQLLVSQLQAQIASLIEWKAEVEVQLRECQQKHADSEREVARLNGLLVGLGDARQHAALIVANEKKASK